MHTHAYICIYTCTYTRTLVRTHAQYKIKISILIQISSYKLLLKLWLNYAKVIKLLKNVNILNIFLNTKRLSFSTLFLRSYL